MTTAPQSTLSYLFGYLNSWVGIIVFAIIYIGICIIVGYISYKKSLLVASIIPFISLSLSILPLLALLSGHIRGSTLFPSILALIIISIFIICRISLRKKGLKEIKQKVNKG